MCVSAHVRSVLLAAASASLFIACEKFDTTRVAPASVSVGQELYGIICDRLVAQNFPEDIEGKRFERVCHAGPNGKFQDAPAVAKEPATTQAAERARIASARIEALSKRRYDLIKAFDTMLPDTQPGYLDGLRNLLADMTPLYDREIPHLTKGTTDILTAIESNQDALNALTRVVNREGYRPLQASAGLLANIATRPEFGDMLDGSLRVFAPGGDNDALLAQLLVSGRDVLRDVSPNVKSGSLGLISRVLLKEDDALFQGGADLYIAKREACGVVGFGPGAGMGMNACSAIDSVGRFTDASGKLVTLPTPFQLVNTTDTTNRDSFGRALSKSGQAVYQYVNLQKAILPGVLADSRGVMNPDKPYAHDFLLNLQPVLGDLSAKVETRTGDISRRFDIYDSNTAPLVDVAIALEPVVKALSQNDFEALDVLARGLKRNEVNAARLVASLVHAKDMANADTYANSVQNSVLWDELLDVFTEVADARDANGNRVPLLEEVMEAFTHPDVQNLPAALSGVMANKDVIDYDKTNPGGAAKNYSSPSFNPALAVNRNALDEGMNRSLFQRLAQIIHETRGVRLCNKHQAYVNMPGLNLMKFDECEMFDVKDMAVFFLQAVVVNGNGNDELAKKGKGKFPMTADALTKLLDAGMILLPGQTAEAAFSAILANGSNIPGMGIYPTPESLARMIFVRDADQNDFVKALSDVAPSQACPLRTVPNGSALFGLRQCTKELGIAERVPGTFFAFETNGFYPALRALGRPFVKYDKEDLFLKVMSVVTRHWPSKNAPDCTSNGLPDTTVNYCSRSNYVSFEPLLAKIFSPEADVITSLRLAKIDLQAEGGVRKLAPAIRAFFSREDNLGLVNRKGEFVSKRNDGFENNYITPAHLVASALAEVEAKRKLDVTAQQQWLKARSGLVDTLLATERTGAPESTRMKSAAQAKLLPELLTGIAGQLRDKKADGSFDKLVNGGLQADTRELLANPMLSGGLKALALLRKDGKAEQAMLKVMYGAFDSSDSSRFMASVASIADAMQALNDESTLRTLLPIVAPAMEPTETGAARATLALFAETSKLDPDHRLTQVISRLVNTLPSGTRTPLEIISETIAEVSRVDPTQTDAPFTAEDTKRVLSETREFLGNKDSGLARIIDVIQRRNVQ